MTISVFLRASLVATFHLLLATLCFWFGLGWAEAAEFKRAYRLDPAFLRVIDGDTISYRSKHFRLYGFDAPERFHPRCPGERALALKATARLDELVRSGPVVRIKVATGIDRYGRPIGILTVGGKDVAPVLIGEGLAVPYFGKGARKNWCAA